MICLDQLMRKRNSNNGGGSVDLTPIYNSLSALSINKLESTAFTFFTNTLTISGAGLPYQINFSDVSVLSANSRCLYNITDSISSLSLSTTTMLKITGPDLISKNSLYVSDLELNVNRISSNTMTLSSIGKINAFDIERNSFRGSSFKGYLMMTGNNMFDNLMRSLVGIDLIGHSMTKNSFSYNKLCNISGAYFTSNTAYVQNVINLNANSAYSNTLDGMGNFNLTANAFHQNSITRAEAGYINLSYADGNTLANVNGHIDAKNMYDNSINWCSWLGRINSFTGNYLSACNFDGSIPYFNQNTMIREMLNVNNGYSFNSNSISSLKNCNLDFITYMSSNTFDNISNLKITADVSFKENSFTEIGNFEYDSGNTNNVFTGNTIQAYTVSIKNMNTNVFTNNSFTIGNFLDFNYGSSNVYDASLNYLLSDYVPESKVLGKYNLVPYVRSLMSGGGGGKQSICAFGVNFSDQINLFPDTIGTLNMNWNFSQLIANVGTLLNKSIDKCLINNWNLSSGGVSGISCSGVVFDSLYYNGAHNKYINTGRLFVGNSDAGNYIRHLYFTNNAVYTASMDTVNDTYPVFSGIEMGSVSASYFQNQFGYCNMLKNTIKNYQIQGLIPNLAAKSCSISIFNFRDFTYVPTPLDSTNPHIMNCTINSVYFTSDTTFSESRIFNRCSIKNALVVCTPLAWDMSSAQFRSAMAEALNGLYNTTTDVIPMTYAETWPN